MRNPRNLMLAVVIAIAAIFASGASAGSNPPQPYQKAAHAKAPVPTVPPKPLAHHGLDMTVRLTEVIHDGKSAAFTSTIRNVGSTPLRFAKVALLWSYDGQTDHSYYGDLSDLPNGMAYVDLPKRWVGAGTLMPGTPYHLDAKVDVPDRKDPVNRGTQETFFCVTLAVRIDYPGKPNAGWTEYSKPNCRMFAVNQ